MQSMAGANLGLASRMCGRIRQEAVGAGEVGDRAHGTPWHVGIAVPPAALRTNHQSDCVDRQASWAPLMAFQGAGRLKAGDVAPPFGDFGLDPSCALAVGFRVAAMLKSRRCAMAVRS